MQTLPHDIVTMTKNLLTEEKKYFTNLHILIFPTICKYVKTVRSNIRKGSYCLKN